jgi:hypothetical protein
MCVSSGSSGRNVAGLTPTEVFALKGLTADGRATRESGPTAAGCGQDFRGLDRVTGVTGQGGIDRQEHFGKPTTTPAGGQPKRDPRELGHSVTHLLHSPVIRFIGLRGVYPFW